MKTIEEVSKYLEDSVEWLKETDAGCCTLKLDDKLAIVVGWSEGYGDEKRNDIIQSENEPDFAIIAGVKVYTSDDMRTDYDFINYPYYANGDICDNGISITPNEDYNNLAKHLLNEYNELKDLDIDKNGLISEVNDEN